MYTQLHNYKSSWWAATTKGRVIRKRCFSIVTIVSSYSSIQEYIIINCAHPRKDILTDIKYTILYIIATNTAFHQFGKCETFIGQRMQQVGKFFDWLASTKQQQIKKKNNEILTLQVCFQSNRSIDRSS